MSVTTIVDPTGVPSRSESTIPSSADSYGAEALEDTHCGKCREDDQCGYKERSDEVHRKYDNYRNNSCDEKVQKIGLRADCFCKTFIECNSEKSVVEQYEKKYHNDR